VSTSHLVTEQTEDLGATEAKKSEGWDDITWLRGAEALALAPSQTRCVFIIANAAPNITDSQFEAMAHALAAVTPANGLPV
jgi:hypothetical protein